MPHQTLLIEIVLKRERMDLLLVRNGGNDSMKVLVLTQNVKMHGLTPKPKLRSYVGSSDAFYHWGGLLGLISVMEDGQETCQPRLVR